MKLKQPKKIHFSFYVDDVFIESKITAWPTCRLMRNLRKKYPNAKTWEVRAEEGSVHCFKGENS